MNLHSIHQTHSFVGTIWNVALPPFKKIQAIAALLKLGLKKYWSQGIRKFIPCKKGENISKQSELYTTVYLCIFIEFWCSDCFDMFFVLFDFSGILWNIIMFQDFRSWGTTVFFSKKCMHYIFFTLLGDIWHHQLVFHRALIWSFTPSVDEAILEMDGNGEFLKEEYLSEMAGFLSPIYIHYLGSCPNPCHTTNSCATPVCPLFLIILLSSLILENVRLCA